MKTIVIATTKDWNRTKAQAFKKIYKKTVIIDSKKELTYSRLKKIDPAYVFIVHWSSIIPEKIYENFTCIGFHMTDLPFGRGGSPLQNLIIRGINNTKISAFKITKIIDGGPVFIKTPLSLRGSAFEIYNRASDKIFLEMIPAIIKHNLQSRVQKGKLVRFKRRTPKDSRLKGCDSLKEAYDFIRMLDAPGYPNAFIDNGCFRFRLSKARLIKGKLTVQAQIEVNHER